MPNSSSNERRPTQSQPCAEAVLTTTAQAAASSLRQPGRTFPKNIIVRSRTSHATLAKPRRRPREYPTEATHQNRPEILDRSKTHDLAQGSSSHIQARTEKPTGNKATDDPPCKIHGESCLGNSCFLCLRSGTHVYAVVVNFAWPGIPIKKKTVEKSKRLKNGEVQITFEDITFRKQGTQPQVMQAIQDAIYQQSGIWKRWLWCYELRTAEEVKFHFDDISEGGRAPIRMTPLPAEEIRNKAQKQIEEAPSDMDYELELACRGDLGHTDECQLDQDRGLPCIQDRLTEASTRLNGYRSRHWLKECLQKPERAQARQFLEQGLLQKSFVYHHRKPAKLPVDAIGLANSVEMRGISVSLGWIVSRMLRHLKVGSVYTLTGLATVWLGSVLWAGHRGDWSTALAFGQLLAASLALMLHHA